VREALGRLSGGSIEEYEILSRPLKEEAVMGE